MTLEMPEELRWLSYLAGSEWPEGDEDALFALAELWKAAAGELREVPGELRAACDLAGASYAGEGADRMREQFELFFSGDQSIEKMAENLAGLGELARDFGAQIEAVKLQIIITLAIVAVEILYALSTLFGAAAIPAIEAAAHGVIRTISQSLLRQLAARAQKHAAMPMWQLALREGVQEAAIGAAVELGVQGIQLAKGHIDEIDRGRVAIAGAVSGISGVVAAPVASWTAGSLSRWVGGKNGMSPWKAGAVGIGSGIGAGVVGAGAGFVANGAITGDWTFTPAMILGGIGGGLAGGVHGVSGYYSGITLQPYMSGVPGGGRSVLPGAGKLASPGAGKSAQPAGAGAPRADDGPTRAGESAAPRSVDGSGAPRLPERPTPPRAGLPRRAEPPLAGGGLSARLGESVFGARDPLPVPAIGATHDAALLDRLAAPPESGRPAEGSAHPTENRNNCAALALERLVALTGSQVAHAPAQPVGPGGMTAAQLEDAAGAPLRYFADHDAIGRQLRELGDGSAALVVDTFAGPADEYGVGAHAYVLHNRDGRIVVVDGVMNREFPLESATHAGVRETHATLYTSDGTPHTAPDQHHRPLQDVRTGFTPAPDVPHPTEHAMSLGTEAPNTTHTALVPDGDSTGTPVLTATDAARADRPDPAPPPLAKDELLHRLTVADRAERMPDIPVPLRVADTADGGAERLVLVDPNGRTTTLPTSGNRPAVLQADGAGLRYYALTEAGHGIRVPAALAGDFAYSPPTGDGAAGRLSWKVRGGQVRFLGTDAAGDPRPFTARGGATVVGRADTEGAVAVKLPGAAAEWVRLTNPGPMLAPLPGATPRHAERLTAPGGPRPADVRAGTAGDGSLPAVLVNLATHNPGDLATAVHDYGDGTAAVRFHTGGAIEWVRVEKELHTDPGTGVGHIVHHEPGRPLWPAVIAKAYAQRFGGTDGYHGIAHDPPHLVASRLGAGSHRSGPGAADRPVAGIADAGFLHPLRFDTDTMHDLTGGDLEFARQAAETYDRWLADLRADGGPASPARLRGFLDREFPGSRANNHWSREKRALVDYYRSVHTGPMAHRTLPAKYANSARWIGKRFEFALRRHTSVVLRTGDLGHGPDGAPRVPGLLSAHSYSVTGTERGPGGTRPARVLLENQWGHTGGCPSPDPGIEYRYDAASRDGYRPAGGGGHERVDADGSRYWYTSDGRQGLDLPDGTRYGMLADGTRYRTDPDGTRYRTHPDGTRTRTGPDGTGLPVTGPGDPAAPPRGGVVAVDLHHLPKFDRLDLAGAGTPGLYGTALTDTVRDFGSTRDGALDLNHITPVPQQTIEWLHQQVWTLVEGSRGPDERFRAAVREVLTARLLSGEWPRLLSTSGMPLRVRYRGRSYPIALRLALRAPRPAESDINPVGIQRWAFGISETSDSSGSGDYRSFSYAYTHTWDTDLGPLRRIGIEPGLSITHNQLATDMSVTSTVQPMILMRSKGGSKPFDYEMVWEFRTGANLGDLLAPPPPDAGWRRGASEPPAERLGVWFPDYLTEHDALPAVRPGDPGTVPAPMSRLREDFPIYLPLGIPNHDRVLADVAASFRPQLRDLSDFSADQLREFCTEGNLRSTIPLAWGGSADTPTLYTRSGDTIGFLRLSMELTGGTEPTGPTTRSSVMESHVLRLLRMQGSSAVTNAFGGSLGLSFGFGAKTADPADAADSIGGQVVVKGGGSRSFGHVLNYGGNSRMSHSLRTGEPFLHVTPVMTLKVELIRPDSAPVPPGRGTPLDGGRDYPVHTLVPSLRTLGHAPTAPRYLPPEVLHLRQLGVSTTPLAVHGTEPLFAQARQYLADRGFFPADRDAPGRRAGATREATGTQRLNNVRKFEQMSTGIGLRSQLDEMIEGGAMAWFELPSPTGTRKVSLKLVAERRYLAVDDPYAGTSHDWTIPGIQTLNYAAATLPGEEQFSRTPFAWNIGGNGSITNPFDDRGSVEFQGFSPEYSYSGQKSTLTGSGTGSGHEYYMLSPTENGIQIFRQTVSYRMELTDTGNEAPAPFTGDGEVRLAVPTYRTLTGKPAEAPRPTPSVVREHSAEDTGKLALPSSGRTLEKGVLRLPESALLDRVGGSKELRQTAVDLIDDLEPAMAREAEEAETPRMPGSYPEDEDAAAESGTEGGARGSGGGDGDRRDHGSGDGGGGERGRVRNALDGTGRWIAGAALDAGRWLRTVTIGEPATNPESTAREVTHTGLSPYHLNGGALRIFRDSYVLEGAGRPGIATGTDIVVEVTGYLTDVQVLPQPPKMDAERWLQSLTAANRTESSQRGHQWGAALTGQYGGGDRRFVPGGAYSHTSSHTHSETVNDNTGVFRVTTEDTAPVYRFAATAHYVVTVKIGARNFLAGLVARGPYAERSRVVTVPDGVEFLLVDNDLQNHPDLLALVHATDDYSRVPAANPPDRRLPAAFTESAGEPGYSAVTAADLRGGRAAFETAALALVEKMSPGVTAPGHANHVPGVRTRINEHTTSLALRTLPNAGPTGRTRFHFVDRNSWLGPQLVEVAFAARPDPGADMESIRGKRVTATSGVDNIVGHSLGEGSALAPPGVTRVDENRETGHQLGFSAGGQHNGHRPRFDLEVQRQSGLTQSQSSSREIRSWQRSFGATSEFPVPYEYIVEVSSRPLTEALSVALLRTGIAGAALLGANLGVLPVLDLTQLTAPIRTMSDSVPADNKLRFNTSETRAGLPSEATADPKAGDVPRAHTAPGIHSADPTKSVPEPAGGDAVIDMETTAAVRRLLAGPSWVPARPIEIYDFGPVDELAAALRSVDPSLATGEHDLGNRTSEGMFIRLNRLVAANRLTVLGPAATAPYLGTGIQGRRGVPAPPLAAGTGPTAVRLTLFAPRIERTSKDIAIDRVELSVDGFRTAAENTIGVTGPFALSSPYSGHDRGGPGVPLVGGDATHGQASSISSQRREFVRFGTPMAKADGSGAAGHRVRALALLEVRGPKGTLWVTGDLLFRTTETPPASDDVDKPCTLDGSALPKDSADPGGDGSEASDTTSESGTPPPDARAVGAKVPTAGGIPAPPGHVWESMPADGDCFLHAVERIAFAGHPPATRAELDQRVLDLRAEIATEVRAHADAYFARFQAILAAAEHANSTDLGPTERDTLLRARAAGTLRAEFDAQIDAIENRQVWEIAIGHLVPAAAGAVLTRRGLGLRLLNHELRATPGWVLAGGDTANATVLQHGDHYYLAVPGGQGEQA